MKQQKVGSAIERFGNWMGLRRRMLQLAGVSFSKRQVTPSVQKELRKSLITCSECESVDACKAWLDDSDAHQTRQDPPEFCGNRETIRRLKSLASDTTPQDR